MMIFHCAASTLVLAETTQSGKRLKIPTAYFKRMDGEMIEWNGIPPDILVPQTEADINQERDKQLERAIAVLQTPPGRTWLHKTRPLVRGSVGIKREALRGVTEVL